MIKRADHVAPITPVTLIPAILLITMHRSEAGQDDVPLHR
jgi:hypothetical protein